ncbi:MAG: 50S ribosomal protein L24e, partial [Methanospirillum sp.]|nr:50S ribosomal protein L24e [Methanospirillum sp.]
HICSFCGLPLEPGTGKMYVKKDGQIFYYCRTKCQKNHRLKRIPRRVRWTTAGRKALGKV